MPGFNGTGPAGMGPRTGWGRGYCNTSQSTYGTATTWGTGYWRNGYAQDFSRIRSSAPGQGFRRGLRSGLGRGRGIGKGPSRRWA
jgi:hypothetical protein